MADGYLKFSCHTPSVIVLDRFNGVSDPTVRRGLSGRTRSSNKDNLNTPENSEVSHPMLELHVANSKTLGPMLDSKYDSKNDPSSYACKVFAEMTDKKIDMEVKHPGEYGDLIMFDNNCLALPCLPSIFSRTQLMGRSVFDYFKEFGHANLYRFPPDHFGFSFAFDPGSSLLPVILLFTHDCGCFKELIRIFTCHMNSTSNAHCILPQFPFDPGANLFIICPGGCLQVFTLQPEASNWDLAICFMSMALIELTAKASYRYIAAATPYITKVLPNAISSCFLVSRVIMSEAKLDSCGQLCFSLLLLIVVKKVFQQQLDFKVLTTCSPEMEFELLNDY
ncbi:hypothetical protein H5410_026752 [Solanum commersonii]|uniref:Uncharacterized protein n=1 Tax=Solanum commersonii TaxID=4109 RepID=A0A9J5Z1J4_SOLCO|nr:hypothetical protein H5410_026752 [Solanum commersonii]